MGKLFLVQVKSSSLIKEDKKALLIPMEIDYEEIKGIEERVVHDALIRDAQKLYPQYTKIEDRPSFSISSMTRKEYQRWRRTNIMKQKSYARGV